jgi:AbrB family looped-hinge helix DNA binding protein
MNLEVIGKISSKGQVTIPKKIRDLLASDIIKFKVHKNEIVIEPVKDVGGSLAKYAKKDQIPTEREKAWEKAVEKYK